MRHEFGNSPDAQRQLDIVLARFMAGEHLSDMSCVMDGIGVTSFNRIYLWLKRGLHTPGGTEYVFREYWSEAHPDGRRKKGSYKIRVLLGKRGPNGETIPIRQMELNL